MCSCQESPDPAAAPPPEATRRGFLQWGSIVLGALAAAAAGVPIFGFLLGPLRRQGDKWVDAGEVAEFQQGTTSLVDLHNPIARQVDGSTGKVAAYVRCVSGDTFQVFSVHCTHLGCPVNWFAEAGLFMCPCHGGVFYADGSHASGPPPRGLYQLEHRVEKGRLMVKLGHLPTLQQPA